jgi:hypothetical protein
MKWSGKFTEKIGRRQKVESARQTAGEYWISLMSDKL